MPLIIIIRIHKIVGSVCCDRISKTAFQLQEKNEYEQKHRRSLEIIEGMATDLHKEKEAYQKRQLETVERVARIKEENVSGHCFHSVGKIFCLLAIF